MFAVEAQQRREAALSGVAVFTGQRPMQHQRAVELLDHPPLRLWDEAPALVVRDAADNLDGDVRRCCSDSVSSGNGMGSSLLAGSFQAFQAVCVGDKCVNAH
jgi:hypothetical protein